MRKRRLKLRCCSQGGCRLPHRGAGELCPRLCSTHHLGHAATAKSSCLGERSSMACCHGHLALRGTPHQDESQTGPSPGLGLWCPRGSATCSPCPVLSCVHQSCVPRPSASTGGDFGENSDHRAKGRCGAGRALTLHSLGRSRVQGPSWTREAPCVP